MIRWVHFELKEESAELVVLLGLEPSTLVIKKLVETIWNIDHKHNSWWINVQQ